MFIAFKDESSEFHSLSKEIIKSLLKNSIELMVSPLTLDEFLFQMYYLLPYNLKRKKKLLYDVLKRGLKDILSLPDLKVVSPPLDFGSQFKVVEYMRDYNLRPRDAYHLLTIFSQGIDGVATFDKDFKRLKDRIEIVSRPL